MKSISTQAFENAVKTLRQGGVVLFPTETSYGLAADATDVQAVRRVFEIKGRSLDKTVPLIAASFAMAEKYLRLSRSLRTLAKIYWPGALTIVAPVQSASLLASGVVRDGTIALRVSSHPLAQRLSQALGRPITATSANRSGEPACYSVPAFLRQQKSLKPDAVLDAGTLPKRIPSTIVTEKDNQLIVLRQGGLKLKPSA